MQADRYLDFVSVLLTFFLRVTVAWLLCFILARLLRRPSQRFLLWLFFSLGSIVYWGMALGGMLLSTTGNALNGRLTGFSLRHIVVAANWAQVLSVAAWLFGAIYLSGLVVLCGCRIWNRLRLRTLLCFGSGPSAPFRVALEALCQELGVRSCELVVLPVITSPATVYWWRPRILLPEICHRPERLTEFVHIMRHELTHIQRRDYLVSAIVDTLCTILFFHPAIWAARRRMRIERELACDLAVVKACPDDRADYAESLARFVRLSFAAKTPSLGVDFAAPASLLGMRIRSILLEPAALPAWEKLSSAGVGIAMVVVFAFLAPQLSVGFDVDHLAGSQVASVRVPTAAQRMKHHVRIAFVVPSQAEHTTQPALRKL